MPDHLEQRVVNVQPWPATRCNATGCALQMRTVRVVGARSGRTAQLPADRTRRTAKASGNGSDAALVVAHGHQDGALPDRQVDIASWHRSTLQKRVLHLVLEAAQATVDARPSFDLA
jgi:hypothetical protein